MRIRGALVLTFGSEFGLYFSDAGPEAALDFCDGRGFSKVAGVVEMLQVGPQIVEEFARKAVAHRLMILPQS